MQFLSKCYSVPLTPPPIRPALLNAVESTMVSHAIKHPAPPLESICSSHSLPFHQVVARDCVQDAGEKFKESAMFYATARQRNAEKEMSEATLRKMHRKALFPASSPAHCLMSHTYPALSFPYRLKSWRAKSKLSSPKRSHSCGTRCTITPR